MRRLRRERIERVSIFDVVGERAALGQGCAENTFRRPSLGKSQPCQPI